jgi:uncharacterized membrane protein
MKKRYVALCLTGTAAIIAMIVAQYMFAPDLTLVSMLYYPFMLVAIQFAVFIANWKRALKLKAKHGWTVNDSVFAETKSSHLRGKLSELPWGWYIFCLAVIFATIILTLARYPSLPDQIPTRYDFNMQPDAWTDKSFWAVMMMPLINLSTLLMMWAVGVVFVKAKLQIDPQKPALSFAQHRVYRGRMGHAIGFLAVGLVVMLALIGLIPVIEVLEISVGVTLAITIVAIIPLLIVPVVSGQGGGKIKLDIDETRNAADSGNLPTQPVREIKTGDDKFWKLGTFYCNPDDPTYIVEDRFGFNIGFNYSRFQVKIGVAVFVLALVALYAWVTPLLLAV